MLFLDQLRHTVDAIVGTPGYGSPGAPGPAGAKGDAGRPGYGRQGEKGDAGRPGSPGMTAYPSQTFSQLVDQQIISAELSIES